MKLSTLNCSRLLPSYTLYTLSYRMVSFWVAVPRGVATVTK